MSNPRVKLSIYRYNPELDQKPFMQNYELELPDHRDIMLLDVLLLLKEQDPTLTFRRSCREGVCGSDGMNVNGRNVLACITHLSSLKQPIQIRPLPGMPVVRDLIVNMDSFYQQYKKVKPYLINEQTAPAQERLQSPAEREKLDGLYECIMCGCCSTACPSYWWNPDRFIGPQGLLTAYRFLSDSRDTHRNARLAALVDPFSVYRCRGIMNCTASCPKGLDPAKAVHHVREALLEEEI